MINEYGFAIDMHINKELALPASATSKAGNDFELARTDGRVALVVEAAEAITLTTQTIDVIISGKSANYDFPLVRINGSTDAKKVFAKGDLMAFINIPCYLKPDIRKFSLLFDVSASVNKKINVYTVLI